MSRSPPLQLSRKPESVVSSAPPAPTAPAQVAAASGDIRSSELRRVTVDEIRAVIKTINSAEKTGTVEITAGSKRAIVSYVMGKAEEFTYYYDSHCLLYHEGEFTHVISLSKAEAKADAYLLERSPSRERLFVLGDDSFKAPLRKPVPAPALPAAAAAAPKKNLADADIEQVD